jgi:hypothetical protein
MAKSRYLVAGHGFIEVHHGFQQPVRRARRIFQFMGVEEGIVLSVAILHLGEFYRFHWGLSKTAMP